MTHIRSKIVDLIFRRVDCMCMCGTDFALPFGFVRFVLVSIDDIEYIISWSLHKTAFFSRFCAHSMNVGHAWFMRIIIPYASAFMSNSPKKTSSACFFSCLRNIEHSVIWYLPASKLLENQLTHHQWFTSTGCYSLSSPIISGVPLIEAVEHFFFVLY